MGKGITDLSDVKPNSSFLLNGTRDSPRQEARPGNVQGLQRSRKLRRCPADALGSIWHQGAQKRISCPSAKEPVAYVLSIIQRPLEEGTRAFWNKIKKTFANYHIGIQVEAAINGYFCQPENIGLNYWMRSRVERR